MSRARGGAGEDVRDREILRWISRFRFVDASVLALKFEVSKERANARLRRLEAAGLVTRSGTPGGTAGWTVSVTRRGLLALGEPPRRPARTDVQREHELALAWLVLTLEARGTTVRTERDSRTLERTTGIRYSADVADPTGRRAKRWPDLVVEYADGRRAAVELERTPKGAARLRRIVDGLRAAEWFAEVHILCASAEVARGVIAALGATVEPLPGLRRHNDGPTIKLAPWPALAQTDRQAIEHAITRASGRASEQPSQPAGLQAGRHAREPAGELAS